MCHFVYSTKQYSSNEEVIKELEKHIPGYSKSKEGIYEFLMPNQEKAIEYAKKLEEYNAQNGKKPHTVEFRPSTEVYKVVNEIKKIES